MITAAPAIARINESKGEGVGFLYLPIAGNRREIEGGLAGMRPELYQRMLRDISEQVRLADDLGYDSVSFTEHHFHIK